MTLLAAGSVALAAVGDRLVAEPPASLHPVAWLGRALGPLDREWSHPRLAGVATALFVPFAAAGVVAVVVALGMRLDPLVGAALAGLACFVSTSRRMLLDEARAVVAASETDLAAARERLRSLAGRDAAALSAGEVRSAAVESAAENLSDGLVAPLAGFALLAPLSLPAAAGAAAWIKAVNTLDSTFGYRSVPMGWAPARLDDVVMWIPARTSAGLLAVAAGRPDALRRARPLARRPASPNAGWPMATLAVVLGVRLSKPGAYDLIEDRRSPDEEVRRTAGSRTRSGDSEASETPRAERDDVPQTTGRSPVSEAGDSRTGSDDLPTRAAAERGVAVVSRAGWLAFGLAAVGVIAAC
ncbi:CobD/CbiB family cobalamin biosynthesis protein [Haloplanus aerogenes]|uniref:Probable cobalamin biosynthesis protein CobD n=1 Tax=Haloplanus aerogenes TaxID=660522 RepID=A0A3M0DQB5_9EURY|nr:CobD/CbiB family cobalamin biosynthesis protein [Haloplanus aerogenes]AZH24579.1 cobalamin biosynthesis protein [Haloplanus aerogenes]RMB23764.1 adenosylcobinamide-phosphate synthase [Haloplanus aerogenes]